MGPTRPLDQPALARLERVLAQQPGNLLARIPVGLTPPEIEDRFAAARLEAPREAVTWWSWRDGSTLDILPGLGHISLASALEGRDVLRRVAAETAQTAFGELRDPDMWWKPTWVPIFDTGGQPKIVLDCVRQPDGLSPLRQIQWDMIGLDGFAASFAGSLGEYIERAVNALEEGLYRYDASRDAWLPPRWAELPPGERF
jgi:cell wall assembly regulator SMI1